VQAARSKGDLISNASFSTRFSTELLKTFTRHLHLNWFFISHWCGNCVHFVFFAANSAFSSTLVSLNSFFGHRGDRDEASSAA
jgi:hypothetical protein